jgi:hypothetical protein
MPCKSPIIIGNPALFGDRCVSHTPKGRRSGSRVSKQTGRPVALAMAIVLIGLASAATAVTVYRYSTAHEAKSAPARTHSVDRAAWASRKCCTETAIRFQRAAQRVLSAAYGGHVWLRGPGLARGYYSGDDLCVLYLPRHSPSLLRSCCQSIMGKQIPIAGARSMGTAIVAAAPIVILSRWNSA